jgi:hypothetical protein
MRLVRSVFSIRPVEIAFKSRFADCRRVSSGSRLGRRLRVFIKKSVCIWAKDGYNLAERVPIAIPERPDPKASTLKWKKPRGASAPNSSGAGIAAWESQQERQLRRTRATACKHPKVRIVSRHDDTEFVECLECGEVFDSEEFRDMEIEETAGTEDQPTDS